MAGDERHIYLYKIVREYSYHILQKSNIAFRNENIILCLYIYTDYTPNIFFPGVKYTHT